MIYEIKRNGIVIAAVRASGLQERSVMALDRVTMSFTLPTAIDFRRGDTVVVYGQTYKMNRAANETQIANKAGYQYELEFEALYYDLAKWQLKGLDKNNQLTQGEVFVMGTAATIVDLIVRNANRVDSGWTIGVVDETDARQFTYVNQSLLAVLQDLSNQFDTEFHIDNKTIHLQKREASTGLVLEYGKGNELYELFRGRTETSVINRLYVEGGSRNLPQGYGHQRLQLPVSNRPYLQAPLDPNEEIIEHSITIENIFPNRTGTITALGANDLEVIDTTIDFNINDHLSGANAIISFVSGQLASFEFEITAYDHATKKITFARITDDKAYPDGVPAGGLKAAVGDQYVLLNLDMPASYVTDAQDKLLLAGQTYLEANLTDKHDYRARLSPIWVKQTNPNIRLGYTVDLIDTARNINKTIRIAGYTRDLQEEANYTEFSLSDTITASTYARQYAQQERILFAIQNAGLLDPEQMRQNLFLNRLSERDGYLFLGPDKVKAGFADYAKDSELWDGHEFDDYMDQPVRTTDEPKFQGTGSPAFASGFAGHGWRMDPDGNHLTVDNLTVRKRMSIYELIINQIRATNGSLWVSDSIKADSVELMPDANHFKCFIDTDDNNIAVPFRLNDIVRCQNWTGRDVKYYTAIVTEVENEYFVISVIEGDSVPEAGDDIVRIGNTTDPNRQGALYLTASDDGAPYMDVLDGVTSADLTGKVKVRLGKLDGIVDALFGQLGGYGLYAENVFLRGRIIQRSGDGVTEQIVPVYKGAYDENEPYYPADQVTYEGSTYINTVFAPSGVLPTDEAYWELYVEKGGSGDPAKFITLSGDQTFVYGNDLNKTVDKEVITISASEHNFTGEPGDRLWEYYNGAAWVQIPNTFNTLTYNLRHDATIWNGGDSVSIRYRVEDLLDQMTIVKLYSGDSSLTVVIQSTYGDHFFNGNIDTTLSALVYFGGENITDTVPSTGFTWTRTSDNPAEDEIWNFHEGKARKTVEIDHTDVYKKAVFNCDVEINL